MGDLGSEFINVNPIPVTSAARVSSFAGGFPAPDGSWDALVRQANSNATALQTAINEVYNGGYVYFPRGRYYIGRADPNLIPIDGPIAPFDAADVLVYPNVTLRFAPGAVLVPMNFKFAPTNSVGMDGNPNEDLLVRIEIQGDIEADMEQIFDTVLSSTAEDDADVGTFSDMLPVRAGLVLFTGNRIREVYPEWWGAFTDVPGGDRGRDRRAIQAAIDAGHTHRYRPRRIRSGSRFLTNPGDLMGEVRWWRRPSIPVVLKNQYSLAGGLQVGMTDEIRAIEDPSLRRPNTDSFVMLGERETGHSGAGAKTLLGATVTSTMLTIKGIPSFSIRGVNFDGNNQAGKLIHFEPGGGSGCAEFKNCVFEKTGNLQGATLVHITGPSSDTSDTMESVPVNVTFTHCRMETLGGVDLTNSSGLISRGIKVAELDLSDDLDVEFRNCMMTGVADPMILAMRGHFTLNECALHMFRCVVEALPADPADWRAFRNNTNGTDIFIAQPTLGAAASFTARAIDSQSFQFLATHRGTDAVLDMGSDFRSACVLINVSATAVPNEPLQLNYNQSRPSIFWDGPGVRGSHLIAVGCRLRASYGARDTVMPAQASPLWSTVLGSIRIVGGLSGAIFHIGNVPSGEGTGQFSIPPTDGEIPPLGIIMPDMDGMHVLVVRILLPYELVSF